MLSAWPWRFLVLIALLIGLPLLGVWLAGERPGAYLEFPPTPRPQPPGDFSWRWFAAIALLIIATVSPFVVRVLTAEAPSPRPMSRRAQFPWWGWLGLGILAVAWVLAWNRFSWFAPLQPYTFTPLWLGYILVINALTWQRTGRCMLVNHTGYFLILFPLSAGFWWFFEYLNGFVANWYYVGGHNGEAVTVFLSASLPFATVLPAVLGTKDWLASFPRLSAGLQDCWRIPAPLASLLPWIALLSGIGGLTGIGIWPDYLFPLVWVAPLLLLVAFQDLAGQDNLLSSMIRGDWRPLWLGALAGLLCGFFWELWNYQSLVHWKYTVRQVHTLQLFEMPLLGYAGYLPFGLTCVAIVDFFFPKERQPGREPDSAQLRQPEVGYVAQKTKR